MEKAGLLHAENTKEAISKVKREINVSLSILGSKQQNPMLAKIGRGKKKCFVLL